MRNNWEDVYALEIFPSGTTLTQIVAGDPVFDGVTTKGVRGIVGNASKCIYNLIPEGEHPTIKASTGLVQSDLAIGKSLDNVASYTAVTKKPDNQTFNVLYNANNLSAFFKLFFQSGISIAAGTTNTALQIMTCTPYLDSAPVQYGNYIRFMQNSGESDEVDEVFKGIIVKKITLKSEEGGIVNGDVELMGAGFDQGSFAGAASTGKLAKCQPFDPIIPLRFEDLTVVLGTSTISIPKFELTFENNAIAHYYNETAAKIIALGKLQVSGTMSIPWNDTSSEGKNKQITDYIANLDKSLRLIWGNPLGSGSLEVDVLAADAKNLISNNYLAIDLNIKITDYNMSDIDGLPMIDITFSSVQDEDDTNGTVTVRLGYAIANNSWS
jgi:hypothetical protein